MSPDANRARLDALVEELKALEAKAGLTERFRKASATTSYNSGWRSVIRPAYFSVPDVELRRALIRKHREVDEANELCVARFVPDLRRELEVAQRNADRLPWTMAAVVGVALVGAGTWLAGTAGAIGGGVAGLLLGMGMIHNARVRGAEVVKRAQEALDDEVSEMEAYSPSPPNFSEREAETGIREGTD